MMGTSERPRTSLQTSSPSLPGSMRSSSTTSYFPPTASASPRRPSPTTTTATPWPSRYSRVSAARRTSSSTRSASSGVVAGSVTSFILADSSRRGAQPPSMPAVHAFHLLGELGALLRGEDVVDLDAGVDGLVGHRLHGLEALVDHGVQPGLVGVGAVPLGEELGPVGLVPLMEGRGPGQHALLDGVDLLALGVGGVEIVERVVHAIADEGGHLGGIARPVAAVAGPAGEDDQAGDAGEAQEDAGAGHVGLRVRP